MREALRIAFLGTAAFAVPALRALAGLSGDAFAVFTRPDRPAGRGRQVRPPPLKTAAAELHVPQYQPERVSAEEGLRLLREFAPELLVVVAFGEILDEAVLTLPRRGAVNLHASLLPKYRGAAPMQRALMAGETVTGVTAQWMARELDAGDIIVQRPAEIGPDEDYGSLHDRLAALAGEVAVETVELIRAHRAPRLPQRAEEASYAPPIRAEERVIDWSRPAEAVRGTVRALSPSPGARTWHRGRMLKVLSASVGKKEGSTGGVPGEVGETGRRGFGVQAGDGWVRVLRVQPEGRTAMSAADYVLGYRIRSGERLG